MIIVLYKKIGPILLDKLVFECPAFHSVDINRLQLYDLSIIEMDKIIKERFFFLGNGKLLIKNQDSCVIKRDILYTVKSLLIVGF